MWPVQRTWGREHSCAKDLGEKESRMLEVAPVTGGSQLMSLEGETKTQRWCLVRKEASHLRKVGTESRKPLGEHS